MTYIAVIVEILTIALLIATIAYAFMLNQRIKTLDENKEHLKQLLQGFSSSLLTAERSIQNLRETGRTAAEVVQKNLKEAQKVRDDLEMLTKRGEEIADTIEHNIRGARHLTPAAENSTPKPQKKRSFAKKATLADISTHQDLTLDKDNLSDVKQQLVGKLKALR